MTTRERIANALLPVLRGHVQGISGSDLDFFGGYADIASPVPRKYGVDLTDDIVYNIRVSSVFDSLPLLESVIQENGYWSFTVSSGVIEYLAAEAASGIERLTPCPEMDTGLDPRFLHARLLDAAERNVGDDIPEARRALWLALTADPERNRSIILRAVADALDRSRRTPGIKRSSALAMAACIEKMFIRS